MAEATTHIATSGDWTCAAFIVNVREPGSRERAVELPLVHQLPFIWYN